jgi:hypothetical protein
VTVCGRLDVPWVVARNEIELGEMLIPGLVTGAPVPEPVSWTVWGEPGASSETVTEALLSPFPSGENTTPIIQLAPATIAPLQVFEAIRKSLMFAPLRATEVMCQAPAPELDSMIG